jgi:hypothetical protein
MNKDIPALKAAILAVEEIKPGLDLDQSTALTLLSIAYSAISIASSLETLASAVTGDKGSTNGVHINVHDIGR